MEEPMRAQGFNPVERDGFVPIALAVRRAARATVAALGILCCSSLAVSTSRASVTLYLDSDGVPLASLAADSPVAPSLPNHDPGRDAAQGLLVEKGGSGVLETDPVKYQQWVGPSAGMSLDGPFNLVFWGAMKNFSIGRRGVVQAFLLDCDPAGASCSEIAQGQVDIMDWSGGWGSWKERSIEFGQLLYTVPQGRSLSVKIVVGVDSDDDMWFAYDTTAFPSRVTDASASDIVIDCSFGDWGNAGGAEFHVQDEGGADDWGSPAQLDITWQAISSNLIDSFQILMGFDDVPPTGGTAALLFDTDLDNMMDYALKATVEVGTATVELYSCDDSLSDGCDSAVLELSYPPSSFCMATAPGPWNQDTMLEISLPFSDLQLSKGDVVLTTLISYAAAAPLASPKDSIFGVSGQDYTGRIYYDTGTGDSGTVGPLAWTYNVRRHTDPSAVRATSPLAFVADAPFDDAPGTLGDGETYYYVVEREGGLPVDLSAHPNDVAGAVRLGFDDNNALSAPVDAARSKVTVAPSVVPADGASYATVTVTPFDWNGVAIGSGCDVSVDDIQLAPGTQAGPVEDNLDGSYSFKVSSTSSGTAQVVVDVEGVFLAATPQITFTN